MNLILFDSHKNRENLLPLSYTRPVADMRVGILTIREKWEKVLGVKSFSLTEDYLQGKFTGCTATGGALYINGSVLPNAALVEAIQTLGAFQSLVAGEHLIALKGEIHHINYQNLEGIAKGYTQIEYKDKISTINYAWDIFQKNGEAIKADFELVTKGRKSQELSDTNKVLGDKSQVFLEEGAKVECAILNASTGPIYLGKDAEIMEGCIIRGPFVLGEHGVMKMAAKVYGPTTIGPYCKAGGEISNSVMFAYSNKGHDGFIGNTVIGEWCNLGADTNTSNLKNNYAGVDVFNYKEGKSIDTGLTFCGLTMGDHAKCGINTMFNTGSVVGVSANIFGGDFPPKFVPSFSWGGAAWLRTFTFDKSLEVAERMMERRELKLEEADRKILREVFTREEKYRKNFK